MEPAFVKTHARVVTAQLGAGVVVERMAAPDITPEVHAGVKIVVAC